MNLVQTADPSPKTFRRYYRPLEPLLGKPKNRVYITTILSFLTVSLFVWYAIRPTVQTILSLRREIKDSTIVSEQMETKIEALIEAQAIYQSIIPQLPLLETAVPGTPDMVYLVKQINNLADSVNATVSATNLSQVSLVSIPEKDAPEEKTITPVTVTLDGTYIDLKAFVNGLYDMRRIVTISDIVLTPFLSDDPSVPSDKLTMTLTLEAYSTYK